MKFNVYLIITFLFFSAGVSFGQKGLQLVVDSVTHEYKVVETPLKSSNLRTAAQDITVTVTPHGARPESMIDIHMEIGPATNIDEISSIYLTIIPDCGDGCMQNGFAHIWLSPRAINKTARTVDLVMGGMQAGKDYRLMTAVFGVDGSACGGDGWIINPFRTGSAVKRQEKMLLVINEEWRSTAAIQEKLDQYIADVKVTRPNLSVEKFHMESNSFDKNRLFEYIRQHHLTDNITYLFFIGANAATTSTRHLLNDEGNIEMTFSSSTFSRYTHPLYKTYTYDAEHDEMRTYRYLNTCLYPPQEVREAVFEQTNPLISMGMIIPAPNLTSQEKISYVTDYFTKLHRFRKKEISFDRKVLITDGFVDEQNVVAMAQANGRWSSASTVAFGREKDPNYSGDDEIWKADYLNKLGTQSYEIMSLNVHGSPDYQSFGIYKEDINNLPALNTQVISLSSCNLGSYGWGDYLGGEYLGKGNVLNVNCYSDLLLLITTNGASALEYEYRNNGAFTLMSQGYAFSDAYRYAAGYVESQVLLGDPLATLRDSDPLPVVLKDFNVTAEGRTAQVSWTTTSETKSAHFEVQRSKNGSDWKQIGKMDSQGESAAEHFYSFTDSQPYSGQNLYRLKMVDLDGTFAYSEIRNLRFEGGKEAVYPNPVSDNIYFDAEMRGQIKSVTVADIAGKIVMQVTSVSNQGISVKSFGTGLYLLRISKMDGSTEVKKVLVNR
ncbi:T9SS type A sorting domain-containing protein [Dyadobacter sp. CY343]|uniref:T9SS type A sorting domain-containing protein n=1 Tax=Dyadobacter sp. CY343 TaxID=2907299 RepID=UPI001F206808|nr:T9SS type A sorting domain-containing protein [Dyadobacter sp. CY343]MCE7059296.1 T9SS type A sorting domain-containing protein [Dyadobacter sp. CY343]